MDLQIILDHWYASGGTTVKNTLANAERHQRWGFNPQSRKIPLSKKCNPLQYSCLENSEDREAWQATVHGVAESQTWLSYWAQTCLRYPSEFQNITIICDLICLYTGTLFMARFANEALLLNVQLEQTNLTSAKINVPFKEYLRPHIPFYSNFIKLACYHCFLFYGIWKCRKDCQFKSNFIS